MFVFSKSVELSEANNLVKAKLQKGSSWIWVYYLSEDQICYRTKEKNIKSQEKKPAYF